MRPSVPAARDGRRSRTRSSALGVDVSDVFQQPAGLPRRPGRESVHALQPHVERDDSSRARTTARIQTASTRSTCATATIRWYRSRPSRRGIARPAPTSSSASTPTARSRSSAERAGLQQRAGDGGDERGREARRFPRDTASAGPARPISKSRRQHADDDLRALAGARFPFSGGPVRKLADAGRGARLRADRHFRRFPFGACCGGSTTTCTCRSV